MELERKSALGLYFIWGSGSHLLVVLPQYLCNGRCIAVTVFCEEGFSWVPAGKTKTGHAVSVWRDATDYILFIKSRVFYGKCFCTGMGGVRKAVWGKDPDCPGISGNYSSHETE